MPVPTSYNLNLIDFARFRNALKAQYLFGEENNIYVLNQDGAPPTKQVSKRRSLKTN